MLSPQQYEQQQYAARVRTGLTRDSVGELTKRLMFEHERKSGKVIKQNKQTEVNKVSVRKFESYVSLNAEGRGGEKEEGEGEGRGECGEQFMICVEKGRM